MLHVSPAGWRNRLKNLLGRLKGDAIDLKTLEPLLYEADFSHSMVDRLLGSLHRSHPKSEEEALGAMERELSAALDFINRPPTPLPVPGAVLLLGVNGSGKTSSAGKLAYHFNKSQGTKVVLAAADTFRAGAIEQLKKWGERVGVPVVSQSAGADPAAVIFDAWQKACAAGGIMIADTAGRLHTQKPLLEELKKIVRVLSKDGRGAPHESYLVLDGTTGQNAAHQAKEFGEALPLTGLIVTKLDGTAKGGAAASCALELKLPIRYLGVGEGVADLEEFNSETFSRAVFRG